MVRDTICFKSKGYENMWLLKKFCWLELLVIRGYSLEILRATHVH